MNWEIEETLRQKFIDGTKNKLWAEDADNDAGFSEEYVNWLEQIVIKNSLNYLCLTFSIETEAFKKTRNLE